MVPVREGSELEPGDQVEGQRGDVRPGLVRGEIKERQLAQAGVFQGLDPVLTPAAGAVPGVQERSVPARGIGQERGDPVPVDIEQGRLRAGVQRLGAEEQVRARRVIRERDDVGGVDDPRIGPVVPGLVQGRLPILFVGDLVDHVCLAERQGVAGGELHAEAVQVPEELP